MATVACACGVRPGDGEHAVAVDPEIKRSVLTRLRRIELSQAARDEIDRKVRGAAYSIIGGKGATHFGIGSALARIVDVILHDQRAIMTVCARTGEVAGVRNVTVSLPRLVGGEGVLETFPLPLNQDETARLRRSAEVIAHALAELGRV